MAGLILRLGFYFIGIAGILIGSSFVCFGVDVTGQFFKTVLDVIYPSGELSGLANANADSELRFYSVFWIAYGLLLVQTARDLTKHLGRIPWLIALFFAGGAARLVSYIMVGPPHALFTLLMAIELILPIILFLAYRRWGVKRS